MLKASSSRLKQRFDEFGFPELAQESQSIAANVFVRVLKV